MSDERPEGDVNYHLELTPQQLKVTHTALKSLLDDFGHDEKLVGRAIHEVLEKLPDEHSIRAIRLDKPEPGTGPSDQAVPPAPRGN